MRRSPRQTWLWWEERLILDQCWLFLQKEKWGKSAIFRHAISGTNFTLIYVQKVKAILYLWPVGFAGDNWGGQAQRRWKNQVQKGSGKNSNRWTGGSRVRLQWSSLQEEKELHVPSVNPLLSICILNSKHKTHGAAIIFWSTSVPSWTEPQGTNRAFLT